MKIIFSVTIVLLIGALVAVNAKGTDVSKELSELFHLSETDEKVLAEGYDGDEKVLSEDDDDDVLVESDNGDEDVLAEDDKEVLADGEGDNKDADALANAMIDEIMAQSDSEEDDNDNLMTPLMADDKAGKKAACLQIFTSLLKHGIRGIRSLFRSGVF